MFLYAMFQQYFPSHLWDPLERCARHLMRFFNPYIEITFDEFAGERWYRKRAQAFLAIRDYLSTTSTAYAKRLKVGEVKGSQSFVLSMDSNEEITDEFEGRKVWWIAGEERPNTRSITLYPNEDQRTYYKLRFHKSDRKVIAEQYLSHVQKQGKAIAMKNRQRKLYCNNPSENWYGYKRSKWSHIAFDHPGTFHTLAMETKKKDEIMNDLIKFSKGKDYYTKIGKAWKRGYLLYGPPGTGKSTMIAAMANLLDYDVYDLELTTVKDNTELKMLLIETSNKSIIVIEDIDCSIDLTGKREKKKDKDDGKAEDEKDTITSMAKEEKKEKDSKVTLSGLLNFIDGLWSSCGGERIIVFTTNYVDKLDPALIRRGRMDKHIEMSYCRYEAFKVLAESYLDIDYDPMFKEIGRLLEEVDMTPADVAENLMPKSDKDDPQTCLKNLIQSLDASKEAMNKAAEK